MDATVPTTWRVVSSTFTRPYRITLPMVLMVSLIPFYIFIPGWLDDRTFYEPALALDRALPLQPIWTLFYGPLYAFLILLPILLVRQQDLIGRAVRAYLLVWLTAYACFLLLPTTLPRPDLVEGGSFGAWLLGLVYSSDPPFNCFPSLHVAHSFVSALVCRRIHRGVGNAAVVAASLVGISAVVIKQHYVLDVVAGALTAWAACSFFLRGHARAGVSALERRAAPVIATALFAFVGLLVAGIWLIYASGVGSG